MAPSWSLAALPGTGAATRTEVCTGLPSARRAPSPRSVTRRAAARRGPALRPCSPQRWAGVVGAAGTVLPPLPWGGRVRVSSALPVGESCVPLVCGAGRGQKGDGKRMAELQGLSGDGGV